MKNKFIFSASVISFLLLCALYSCQGSLSDITIEQVSSETLAKDSKLNEIIEGLNDIEMRLQRQISSLHSKEEKGIFLSKLQFLASKARNNNLDKADIENWSNMLGYYDYQTMLTVEDEQKKRVDEFLSQYPTLKGVSDTEKERLFEEAFKISSVKRPVQVMTRDAADGCQPGYAICSSAAFGGYIVAITGPCQGAWILGPGGFTACAAGASLVYAGALYGCWTKFCDIQ